VYNAGLSEFGERRRSKADFKAQMKLLKAFQQYQAIYKLAKRQLSEQNKEKRKPKPVKQDAPVISAKP